ncbi:MAG: hypothetical protein JWL83_4511 [Actinomycetia bacterium]|nr:hypothetical protein [Actinomycetes bacterium]
MSSTPQLRHLNNHHRDTLLHIFQHPTSANVDWKDALSLLEVVGSVEQRRDGKFAVQIGDETAFFARPKNKDLDIEQVVELRRMLTNAGYGALVEELEAKGKEV